MSGNNQEPKAGCVLWLLGIGLLLGIGGIIAIAVVPELRAGWDELVEIFRSSF